MELRKGKNTGVEVKHSAQTGRHIIRDLVLREFRFALAPHAEVIDFRLDLGVREMDLRGSKTSSQFQTPGDFFITGRQVESRLQLYRAGHYRRIISDSQLQQIFHSCLLNRYVQENVVPFHVLDS